MFVHSNEVTEQRKFPFAEVSIKEELFLKWDQKLGIGRVIYDVSR